MFRKFLISVLSFQLLMSSHSSALDASGASELFALPEATESGTGLSATDAPYFLTTMAGASAFALLAALAYVSIQVNPFVIKFVTEAINNRNRRLLLIELVEKHKPELIQYVKSNTLPPLRTQDYLSRVRQGYSVETKNLSDYELAKNLMLAVQVLEKAKELTEKEIQGKELILDPSIIKNGK